MTQIQVSGSVVAILGLLIFFITPYQVGSSPSGAYPRIISVCLLILGILVAVTSGKQKNLDDVNIFDPILLCYLCLFFGSIVLIRVIGFYPSIIITLPTFLVLFGEKNIKKIILFSIITTGMIYLIIDLILGSSLP